MSKIAPLMSNEITELALSEHMKVKFNEIRKDYNNHLGSGACRDFSEYQKMLHRYAS